MPRKARKRTGAAVVLVGRAPQRDDRALDLAEAVEQLQREDGLQLRSDRDPERPDLRLVGEFDFGQETRLMADRVDDFAGFEQCGQGGRLMAEARCWSMRSDPCVAVQRGRRITVREVNEAVNEITWKWLISLSFLP